MPEEGRIPPIPQGLCEQRETLSSCPAEASKSLFVFHFVILKSDVDEAVRIRMKKIAPPHCWVSLFCVLFSLSYAVLLLSLLPLLWAILYDPMHVWQFSYNMCNGLVHLWRMHQLLVIRPHHSVVHLMTCFMTKKINANLFPQMPKRLKNNASEKKSKM